MREQAQSWSPEKFRIAPKVYEGEILPPLPKPKPTIHNDEAARMQVIRMELNTYIRETPKLPLPQVIIVEKPIPQPETVWDQIGMAIGDGIAEVRAFASEVSTVWRHIGKQGRLKLG